jgi:hypothetical protein
VWLGKKACEFLGLVKFGGLVDFWGLLNFKA